MKREFSAGGIVFNKKGEVLLIKNASMRDPGKTYWGFPKGRIEEGESSKVAALREVEEEAGIKVEVIGKTGNSKYVFEDKGERIFKVVIVFLMKHLNGELTPQKSEITECAWVQPEEALKILSFNNDKVLLKKALEIKEDSGRTSLPE